MARLIVLGPEGAQRFEVQERAVIGRESDCDIPIEDGASSRRHCVVEKRGDVFFLRDLGSSNGTKVNAEKVKEIQLQTDDQIKVGTTILVFEAD